jgi:hypothetical protein
MLESTIRRPLSRESDGDWTTRNGRIVRIAV